MLNHSGIGTYIHNLVPRITGALPEFKFNLIGDTQRMRHLAWIQGENITLIDCVSPIYSMSEQLNLLRKIPEDTSLFWSPHYNIPLLYRGRLVVTVHDIAHLSLPETAKGLHKQLYARILFNSVRIRADVVIFVSAFSRQEFIRLVGRPGQLNHVIYNGISKVRNGLAEKQRPHAKPYLLFVGNVKPHKNIAGILKAFERIKHKIPHDLLIVGRKDGFITGDTEVIDNAWKLSGRVHFTGEIYNESLQQYYASAEALIFPSLYEGFGLPPLEAMSYGCPVVVSHVASLPEVCGNAANYVDPYNVESIAEGIYKMVTDEALRQDLIRKGHERVKLFSWGKSAEEHIRIFQEVLKLR